MFSSYKAMHQLQRAFCHFVCILPAFAHYSHIFNQSCLTGTFCYKTQEFMLPKQVIFQLKSWNKCTWTVLHCYKSFVLCRKRSETTSEYDELMLHEQPAVTRNITLCSWSWKFVPNAERWGDIQYSSNYLLRNTLPFKEKDKNLPTHYQLFWFLYSNQTHITLLRPKHSDTQQE